MELNLGVIAVVEAFELYAYIEIRNLAIEVVERGFHLLQFDLNL